MNNSETDPQRVDLGDRGARVAWRARDPRWKANPRTIDASECIHCQSCLRACPDAFGAIVNLSRDIAIIPELCSGCPACVVVCPVDCIYPLENWTPTTDEGIWLEVSE